MNTFDYLLKASSLTITLALTALVLGLVLALIFTVWESARFKPFAYLGSTFIALIRGLPEILVILFIYEGLSLLFILLVDGVTLNFGLFQLLLQLNEERWLYGINPFWCGVLALALLYASYASQTLRGAIKAIPQGQWESGRALGLRKHTIFFQLIVPQIWKHALPGLGNQWLVLLKDTALVSLISVNDLMKQTETIIVQTREPFTWYLIAALVYLTITLLSQFILSRINLRVTHFERRNAS